jgi:hypothetical protein
MLGNSTTIFVAPATFSKGSQLLQQNPQNIQKPPTRTQLHRQDAEVAHKTTVAPSTGEGSNKNINQYYHASMI